MEQSLRWSKRAHNSKLLVARRVRSQKHDARLRKLFPQKFEFDVTSPSAVMQHAGWVMSQGFPEGVVYSKRMLAFAEKRYRRLRDTRLRSFGYLYANPRHHMEDKMFIIHDKELKALSHAWRYRVEMKQWKIEAAFYDEVV